MLRLSTFFAIFVFVLTCTIAFRSQSVWVKAHLFCGNTPAVSVIVKLFDKDHGPNPDDLLDYNRTNASGHFELKGSSTEMSNIDPEVRIYHDCNDYGKPCQREWIIRIPDQYVFSGKEPTRPMNLGFLNLEVELENEVKECA